jgi:hypothetical protein
LFVDSLIANSVLRYDETTGAFVDEFVKKHSGGQYSSADMDIGRDHNLGPRRGRGRRVGGRVGRGSAGGASTSVWGWSMTVTFSITAALQR